LSAALLTIRFSLTRPSESAADRVINAKVHATANGKQMLIVSNRCRSAEYPMSSFTLQFLLVVVPQFGGAAFNAPSGPRDELLLPSSGTLLWTAKVKKMLRSARITKRKRLEQSFSDALFQHLKAIIKLVATNGAGLMFSAINANSGQRYASRMVLEYNLSRVLCI
jgi:hypothetical protein